MLSQCLWWQTLYHPFAFRINKYRLTIYSVLGTYDQNVIFDGAYGLLGETK